MSDYILIDGTLYHHGILGQKWGIRRFQNKDGSYTAEGKQRYYKDYYGYSGEIKNKKTYREAMKGAKDTFEYNKKWIDKNYDGTKRDKRDLKKAEKGIYREGRKEIKDAYRQTTDYKVRNAAKVGLGIVGASLVAYGAYKIYQNSNQLEAYKKLGKKNVDFIRNSGKFDYLTPIKEKKSFNDTPISTIKSVIDFSNTKSETNRINYNNDNFNKYNAMLSRLENQLQQDPSNMALRKQINEISKKIFD